MFSPYLNRSLFGENYNRELCKSKGALRSTSECPITGPKLLASFPLTDSVRTYTVWF